MVGCAERIWEAGKSQDEAPNPYFFSRPEDSEEKIQRIKTAEWNTDLAIGKVAIASSSGRADAVSNLARSCSGDSADPTLGAPACKTTLTSPTRYSGITRYGYYGVDGNSGGTAFQTTYGEFREWNVTFQSDRNIIEEVFVYNINSDEYAWRLSGAKLNVVDINDNVVASRTLTGDPGLQVYTFSELPVGSRVSINKNAVSLLAHEVEVYGRPVEVDSSKCCDPSFVIDGLSDTYWQSE